MVVRQKGTRDFLTLGAAFEGGKPGTFSLLLEDGYCEAVAIVAKMKDGTKKVVRNSTHFVDLYEEPAEEDDDGFDF